MVRMRLAFLLQRYAMPLDIGMALLACAYLLVGAFNDGAFGIRANSLSLDVEIVITATFLVEYAVRLYAASDRWRFIRTHLIELLALISTLRVLRALQFLRLLRLLRFARLAVFIRTYSRLVVAFEEASEAFSDPLLAYGIIGMTVLVFLGALALLQFERGMNPNIHDFKDAFWAATSMVLTIGFSSTKAVTPEGRFVAGVLIVGGLTCISFFTTSFTVRFQKKAADENANRLRRIESMLEQLLEREIMIIPDDKAS